MRCDVFELAAMVKIAVQQDNRPLRACGPEDMPGKLYAAGFKRAEIMLYTPKPVFDIKAVILKIHPYRIGVGFCACRG